MKTMMIVRPERMPATDNVHTLHFCVRFLCPRLAWSLSLILLVELSGCGPAAPDHAPNQQSRASLASPSKSQPVSPRALAASPGIPAATSTSNHTPAPAVKEEPAPLSDHLVLPAWIAQALDAPEVSVRLQALDMWAQQGVQAPLDPLIVALDDEDDEVQSKAMTIIEQHWAVEQEEEAAAPEAEK